MVVMMISISISISMTMTMMMTRTKSMSISTSMTRTMTMWRGPCVCRFGLKWGEGRILTYVREQHTDYDASTEATANVPTFHAATRAMGCSPHKRSWHTCCMLHLHRDPRASSSNENGVGIENQQERKEGHNPNRRKGKKEGRREGRKGGRKGGRQEERNKGRAPKWCALWTCYFQRVAGSKQFANVGFKMWQRPCSLQILAATHCKHHAAMCNLQMIISIFCEAQPLIGLSFRKS